MPKDHKDQTIGELIALARDNFSNEEVYRDLLWELRNRASVEMLEKATTLTASELADDRILSVQILCQLGNAKPRFVKQSGNVLLTMLLTEEIPEVIASIAWGLGHLRTEGAEGQLIGLKDHAAADVRLGVVGGLLGLSTLPAVQTLITLSRDQNPNVRSWATFGLGTQISDDSSAIRQALVDRLLDDDAETSSEAVWGLAQRKDVRAVDCLIKRLSVDTVVYDDLLAAQALGDGRLLPALNNLRQYLVEEREALEKAIRICESL